MKDVERPIQDAASSVRSGAILSDRMMAPFKRLVFLGDDEEGVALEVMAVEL